VRAHPHVRFYPHGLAAAHHVLLMSVLPICVLDLRPLFVLVLKFKGRPTRHLRGAISYMQRKQLSEYSIVVQADVGGKAGVGSRYRSIVYNHVLAMTYLRHASSRF